MQEKNTRTDQLKSPVRYIKGVGPKRGELLAKLGIETIEGLLYYLPSRYEDRSNFTAIKDIKIGEYQTIRGEVVTSSARRARSGAPVFQIAVTDTTGFIHAAWFNQPYLKDYFRRGQNVVLYGKVEHYDKVQMVQPEYEILKGDESDFINIGRIVPVYPATSRLTQRYLRSLTHEATAKYTKMLPEILPTYLIARQSLVDARFAVKNIHFPSNFTALERAYKRIVFEEFFMLQLALALRKRGLRSDATAPGHRLAGSITKSFSERLPFELTADQKRALDDISRDMSSTKPMNRLLEGDVGSGKTVVAAYALALTVENGFQGVIMAPTEILARQHFVVLSELLMPLGINVALLIGGIGQDTKKRIYDEIKSGSINIVVGTHAVIQEGVEFKRVGLAVIDEQHKFGVTQRSALKKKGYNPHVLVMTATPIPRTLAMTVYGDLDMSVIKEMPKGRGAINTYWVEEARRENVYGFVREQLKTGRQAYVVCPLIEKGPGAGVRGQGAEEMHEKLKKEFAEFKVGLLHGRMASADKDKVMKDFKKRKIDVLVSTVVIEVGIDVPNATVMLVENADRFGLSQLHQLRGRIGRGVHESYCILLADPSSEAAAGRLKAIEGTLDGFEIAEADLDIRGPGEFFGTKQHGLPEIKFGNILKDFDIMDAARKEAFALVGTDPMLNEEHHRRLKDAVGERFGEKMNLAKVG